LIFTIKNTIKKDDDLDHYSGIGLQNIKKRLDLIYPKGYDLNIESRDDLFVVKLSIFNINPTQNVKND
jgi:sensor histidine kinase YesM